MQTVGKTLLLRFAVVRMKPWRVMLWPYATFQSIFSLDSIVSVMYKNQIKSTIEKYTASPIGKSSNFDGTCRFKLITLYK